MTTELKNNWHEANKHYLIMAIRGAQEEISFHRQNQNGKRKYKPGSDIQKTLAKLTEEMQDAAALVQCSELFGLSSFEQKILLMCAATELDSGFSASLSSGLDGKIETVPTFGMALASFSDAHWSALSPESPLRYWQLLELKDPSSITKSPLFISERILQYLTGIQHLDNILSGITEPYAGEMNLVDSHLEIAAKICKIIIPENEKGLLPVIQLKGNNNTDKPALAAKVCEQLGIRFYRMSSTAIPDQPKEINYLARIWNRESALSSSALYIECTEADISTPTTLQSVRMFCNNVQSLLFVECKEWSPALNRSVFTFEIDKPTANEQLGLWEVSLNSHAKKSNGSLLKMVSQFSMTAGLIRKTSTEVIARVTSAELEGKNLDIDGLIRQACCKNTRPGLDVLARRVVPMASWDDLVLPENQKGTLREIAMHVQQKSKVYNDWGFAKKTSRGLGISALFTGESGTGKTLASEVLANELQLDLYRIDLSQVVNKYIGETEKNLKKIFDAADEGGAILLFDEADALFGKRSDVKDSHDRYANIEVSYLLQRMEAYRGLAILTTNLKTSLDKAFLRRLRFVVQFPFPDAGQRREIWKRVFPKETPVRDIEMEKLAKLNIAGGNIRNIAMNAAFIAADANEKVTMEHIRRAAKSEYAKLEKPMSTSESGSWL